MSSDRPRLEDIQVPASASTDDIPYVDADGYLKLKAPSAGGSAHVVEDEGTPVTDRANLNFVGDGVTVTDDGVDTTTVTIPGAPTSGGTTGGTATFPFSTVQAGLPNSNEGHVPFTSVVWFVDSTGAWPQSAGLGAMLVDMIGPDMEAEWKVAGRSGTSSQNDGGVYVRFKDPNNYYYVDDITNSIRFIKVVAGTLSVVQSSISAVALNDVVKLKIQGTTWTVYKNGVSVATGTDSGVSTGRYAGLKTPSTVTSWRVRDFVATKL